MAVIKKPFKEISMDFNKDFKRVWEKFFDTVPINSEDSNFSYERKWTGFSKDMGQLLVHYEDVWSMGLLPI